MNPSSKMTESATRELSDTGNGLRFTMHALRDAQLPCTSRACPKRWRSSPADGRWTCRSVSQESSRHSQPQLQNTCTRRIACRKHQATWEMQREMHFKRYVVCDGGASESYLVRALDSSLEWTLWRPPKASPWVSGGSSRKAQP